MGRERGEGEVGKEEGDDGRGRAVQSLDRVGRRLTVLREREAGAWGRRSLGRKSASSATMQPESPKIVRSASRA